MSTKYKVKALKPLKLWVNVWEMGQVKLPRNHIGESQGYMPKLRSVEKELVLEAGETLDDIVFLTDIREDREEGFLPFPTQTLPEPKVGEKTNYKDLFEITRIE
jgi:hypothetical protein